jgi:hypothetical protein
MIYHLQQQQQQKNQHQQRSQRQQHRLNQQQQQRQEAEDDEGEGDEDEVKTMQQLLMRQQQLQESLQGSLQGPLQGYSDPNAGYSQEDMRAMEQQYLQYQQYSQQHMAQQEQGMMHPSMYGGAYDQQLRQQLQSIMESVGVSGSSSMQGGNAQQMPPPVPEAGEGQADYPAELSADFARMMSRSEAGNEAVPSSPSTAASAREGWYSMQPFANDLSGYGNLGNTNIPGSTSNSHVDAASKVSDLPFYPPRASTDGYGYSRTSSSRRARASSGAPSSQQPRSKAMLANAIREGPLNGLLEECNDQDFWELDEACQAIGLNTSPKGVSFRRDVERSRSSRKVDNSLNLLFPAGDEVDSATFSLSSYK